MTRSDHQSAEIRGNMASVRSAWSVAFHIQMTGVVVANTSHMYASLSYPACDV